MSVSDFEADKVVRERTYTERGLAYQVDQRSSSLKRQISQWHQAAEQLNVVLSDSSDSDAITSKRDQLISIMNSIRQEYTILKSLLGPTINEEPIHLKYEQLEQEHHKIISKVSDGLREIRSESSNVFSALCSHKSKHSSRSSKKSRTSHRSDKQELVAQAESLKIKLKYLDIESKAKLEYERIKALKDLDITKANLEAHEAIAENEIETKIDLPSQPKENLVRDYISAHSPVISKCDEQEVKNIPITTSKITLPTASVSNITVKKESEYSFPPLAKKLTSDVKVSSQERKQSILNPLASTFTPPFLASDSYGNTLVPLVYNRDDRVEHGLTELAKILADQVSLSRLPPPEPTVFNGDPLMYSGWKAAFQTLIEQRQIPKTEQIHYLKKYLGGTAKESVEHFFLLSSDKAYDEAKKLLDERFGDPFVIGNAFRDKLERWPKIASRDSKALLKFSDFLKQCSAAMDSIGTLRVLDDDRENRKIIAKLPDWIINRWARIVHQWKEDIKGFPTFKCFVDFISKEAKIATDPVTSLQSLKFEDSRTDKYVPVKPTRKFEGRSFVVDTEQKPEVKCLLCSKGHDLDSCGIFLKKTINERKEYARNKGLCFACLSSGHISRKCKKRKKCKKCSKLHPTSLHGDTGGQRNPGDNSRDTPVKASTSGETHQISHTGITGISFLNSRCSQSKSSMVLPVYLSHCDNPENERLVYALLDTQSDTTFILDDTYKSLGLSGIDVRLKLSTMLAESKTVKSTKLKGLLVRGYNSNDRIPLPDTLSRNIIPANRNHIPTPEIARSWPHLAVIADELLPIADCEIGLLIGYNCSRALMPREIIPPNGDGPYGQKTDLGWGIVGIVDHVNSCTTDEDNIGISHRTMVYEVPSELVPCDTTLDKVTFALRTSVKVIDPIDVANLMELDFSENTVFEETLSQDERRFLKVVGDGIRLENGHYTMPLPFKGQQPKLPNNRNVALRRLNNLTKKFKTDQRYFVLYKEFIENLISQDYAEQVELSNVTTDTCEWYIPHHGVFHPRKPDKLRVVFDCSATFKEQSLNAHLLQGPDLTNKLVGVLCRFRQGKIAFTCDIEQMFHQFFVHKEFRDFLRFLWWKDDAFTEPVVFRMCVHLFGATSSPGCANFGLKQIATDNEIALGKDVADFLRKDFYVDDGLKSLSSVEEAVDVIKGSQAMCKNGGLRLHKFSSNSKEVLNEIPREDRAVGLKDIDIFNDKLPTEFTLGVQWNIESDAFQFRIVLNDKPLTRRGILSTVSSVYDPLGFISPVILVGKQILQKTCGQDIGWDDPIPEELHMLWERWRNDLKELADLQIQRCVTPDEFDKISECEFHHFSDASFTGYGQCSCLRLKDVAGRIHCSLLMGKARVAPRKAITIPRLELTAAVVSVKVHALLKQEFEFANALHYFWTDSSIVLGYIMNDARRFHVFVSNRVQQIRDQTSLSQWRYVPTKDNPADIASRGATASELLSSNWLRGPQFLWKAELPAQRDFSDMSNEECMKDDPEVKRIQVFATSAVTTQSMLDRLDYFSDWFKAKRAIANCVHFKSLLQKRKDKGTDVEGSFKNKESLSVEDLQKAEFEILRMVQKIYFDKDLEKLKRSSTVGTESILQRLDPILDDNGIIRVGGRSRQSLDSYEVKHPVILPRKCHVTQLIVKHYHERVQHQGRGITTNEIRSNGFWIIGCSAAVSSLIYNCFKCRKLRGRSQDQKMADLPIDRLDPAPPFSYCGVDYFGPFYVKEGRKELKRYGVIFTCFTSRAVHLEIANSLDTTSFINALRRFLCIRGPIRQLRSDQGTNFIGAKNELQKSVSEMDDKQVAQFLKTEGCDYFQFKTNVPHASHMGGVWERQIRTVRSILTNLLCNLGKQLDDESLRTFICEVTAIINSRPLSVENLNDPLSQVLTPNHLLTMKSKLLLPPPGKFVKQDLYVQRRWRRIQYLANEFWLRWRREYLSNLQSRDKWAKKRRNMKVGDVVMIKDDNLSRNMWRLSKIIEAHEDDDGLVRKVKVVIGTSDLDKRGVRKSKLSELERPVHKLVLLRETEEFPIEEP